MDNKLEKPGIKTTEFWVASLTPIFVPIVMVFINKFGFHIPEEAITMIISSSLATPIAYILGRIYNKKQVANIEMAKIKQGESK